MTEKEIKAFLDADAKIKISFGQYEPPTLSEEGDEYLSESEVLELAKNLIAGCNVTQQDVVNLLKLNGHHKVSRQAVGKIARGEGGTAMIKLALAIVTHLYPNDIEFSDEKYYLLIGPESPKHPRNK